MLGGHFLGVLGGHFLGVWGGSLLPQAAWGVGHTFFHSR